MSKLANALILAASLASFSAPAMATGLSMNEVELRAGASIDDCKAAGRAAISQAGLQAMPDSPASVFGATPTNELIAIYCLPQRGIAIIAVAGGDNAQTRPILNRLMGLWSGR
jgi:hypothetical protein